MKRNYCILAAVMMLACMAGAEYAEAQSHGHLRVAFVGDPQVDDSVELGYARNSIYKELRQRDDIDFAIILGDLVNDSMDLMGPSKESLDSLPYPWFLVPGNHDFDVYNGRKAKVRQPGRDRDLVTYKSLFGGPDTTFVAAGIRFILMNDMIFDGAEYGGGFDTAQHEYLDSVVNCSGGERLLVLATHIPYSHIKDRETADSLLSEYPGEILFVSGHTHRVRRGDVTLSSGKSFPELVPGATCGSWWRGRKDEHGIPYALQNCGAPRGYFIADFRRKGYDMEYKCVGKDNDFQSSAWAVQTDSCKRLVVNVFGGAVDGKVKVKAKGLADSRWTTLEMKGEMAPEVIEVIKERDAMSKKERRARRSEIIPLIHARSPHVWSVEIPDDAAIEQVRIRYSDPFMSFRSTVAVRQLALSAPKE